MLFQALPPDTKGGLVKTCVSSFDSKPYGTIESLAQQQLQLIGVQVGQTYVIPTCCSTSYKSKLGKDVCLWF